MAVTVSAAAGIFAPCIGLAGYLTEPVTWLTSAQTASAFGEKKTRKPPLLLVRNDQDEDADNT